MPNPSLGLTMPITDETDYGAVDRYMEEHIERFIRAVEHQFVYAGESAVAVARQSHTYKDRTGNLTSSIGYVVAVDGKVTHESDFNKVLDGDQGPAKGRALAQSIAEQFPEGVTLVVVAGMDYAIYVANRGFDVIDSGYLNTRALLPVLMRQLKIEN